MCLCVSMSMCEHVGIHELCMLEGAVSLQHRSGNHMRHGVMLMTICTDTNKWSAGLLFTSRQVFDLDLGKHPVCILVATRHRIRYGLNSPRKVLLSSQYE